MKKLLLILLLLLGACSSAPQKSTSEIAREEAMNELVMYAMSLSDTPYRYGGNSPESGFDCSGFVRHVFQQSLGLKLPRTSAEISRSGTGLEMSQLRPGDLVFFNTLQREFSHVGIYVGKNRFVHAPQRGRAVSVANMDERYWREHYNGARRIALGTHQHSRAEQEWLPDTPLACL